jgi:hypothetical protein
MKKIVFAVAVLVLALAVTNVAEAAGRRGGSHQTRKQTYRKGHKKSSRSSGGWKTHNKMHRNKTWQSGRSGSNTGRYGRSTSPSKTSQPTHGLRTKDQSTGNKGAVPQNFVGGAARGAANAQLFANPKRVIQR